MFNTGLKKETRFYWTYQVQEGILLEKSLLISQGVS